MTLQTAFILSTDDDSLTPIEYKALPKKIPVEVTRSDIDIPLP